MRVSGFLSDLLAMFEDHPEGITFDAEIVGLFCQALEEALEAQVILERSVEIMAEEVGAEELPLPADYKRALGRQQLVKGAIALDETRRVIVLPHAMWDQLERIAFSDGREG